MNPRCRWGIPGCTTPEHWIAEERELADEHRAENAAAAYEASEGQYGAPVTAQADGEL